MEKYKIEVVNQGDLGYILWNIVTENKSVVNFRDLTFFGVSKAYTMYSAEKGGVPVKESNDPYADLDDLIFDDEDGGPSER